LDADAEKVAPTQFLGKTKEEIERLIMGLDHVSAAEVKFSPSWIRKSPTVVDHVKVIVKNIK